MSEEAEQKETTVVPSELREAIDALAAAVDKHSQIKALISKALTDRGLVDGVYREVFKQLAESEAAVVMDGGSHDPAIRKKVSEKQQAVLICDARISGLQGREQSARLEVDVCMRAVGMAEESWRKLEVEAACDAVRKAIETFLAAIETPIGVGIALGDHRLSSFSKCAELPVYFDVDGRNRNPLLVLRRWNENAAMREGVLSYSAVHQEATASITAARQALMGAGHVPEKPVVG
jgi:hypothetical protein